MMALDSGEGLFCCAKVRYDIKPIVAAMMIENLLFINQYTLGAGGAASGAGASSPLRPKSPLMTSPVRLPGVCTISLS